MKLDALLSTIILVSFLVTIMMAVGSYVAYKLREAAEIVLTEVQHMEAAATRFQQRAEKRGGRNIPATR